jgi:hypothetical protein
MVDCGLGLYFIIETLVKRNLLKTLDGEILEVTEVEDMEQEIMDTEIQTQATVNHSYLIHSIIQVLGHRRHFLQFFRLSC